ncbi:lytic polysaccharide monooxygenase [Xylona heveae TC161]|uniref:Lytic polysaccharide monooxygenase n=1 Tax=Xylona heveae (strain CBS 132557 / TC161) TaxID=1328760 RepID=A0A164ZUH7_XYLHT|nr:lytic polysaccharide monooxygenase [Xylona heveae TC161]KZF19541.1 lytic polysaccharide monooxygenase [Xylona heveae TC161]
MKQSTLAYALLLSAAACLVEGHRSSSYMEWPIPIRGHLEVRYAYDEIDYNMMEPLVTHSSDFPCKGYLKDKNIYTGAVLTSGMQYNMTLINSSPNHRGSCQFSLSYDNGTSFRVIKSIMGGCATTTKMNFTVPSFAPEGTAIFAWTWINRDQLPEFYMNCAQVEIMSPYSLPESPKSKLRTSFRKRSFYARDTLLDEPTSMEHLPEVFIANLESVNSCKTKEGEALVYPHPGPEVEFGDGVSPDSKPTENLCDDSIPPPQTLPQPNNDVRLAEDGFLPQDDSPLEIVPRPLETSQGDHASSSQSQANPPTDNASQLENATFSSADASPAEDSPLSGND